MTLVQVSSKKGIMEQIMVVLWIKTAADRYIFSLDKWILTSVHFSPWFCYRESVNSFTRFWIIIGWEHVHVEFQRNSRKAALGDTTNDFYVGISFPPPFLGFLLQAEWDPGGGGGQLKVILKMRHTWFPGYSDAFKYRLNSPLQCQSVAVSLRWCVRCSCFWFIS